MSGAGKLVALVADDEPIARRGLERMLKAQSDVETVIVCANGVAAREALQENRIDVAFLDVAMPGLTGVEVVRAIEPDGRPAVVFVTAFDRFAIDAFELYAVDYLLKPFDEARFFTAMERVRDRLAVKGRRGPPDMEGVFASFDGRNPGDARIPVKVGEKLLLIRIADIDWCEAEDNYVGIHTGGRKHLVRMTLRALEERLRGADFARIHRSALVNMARVRELRPKLHGEYDVVLTDGTRLTLTRSFRDVVLARRKSTSARPASP